MIERIADKSSYGAIDPVFVAPPSRSNTEPFDSALSRAASGSRVHERPEPRVDDRDRTRSRTNADERREDRSEAASAASSRAQSDEDSSTDLQSEAKSHEAYQPSDTKASDQSVGDEQAHSSEQVAEPSEVKDQADAEDEEATGEELAAAAEEIANADTAAIVVRADASVPVEPTAETRDGETVAAEQSLDDAFGRAEGAGLKSTQSGQLAEQHTSTSEAAAVEGSENNSTGEKEQAPKTDAVSVLSSSTPDARAAATSKKASRESDEQAEVSSTTDAQSTAAVSGEETTLRAVPAQSTASGAERQTRSGTRSGTPRGERATPAASASAALVQQAASASAASAESSTGAATSDTTAQSSGTPQAAAPSSGVAAAASPTPRESSPGANISDPRTQSARLSNGHGNAAARAANGASGEAEVQRVRLVQRVARAFQTIGEAGGEVRLRLSPPSLGSIKLEVTLQNGIMAARIETETAAARTMLVENLPALRERLATHDIKVARFDVEVSADSRQQQQSPQQDGAPRERTTSGMFRDGRQSNRETAVPAPVRQQQSRSALDVLI